MLKIDLNNFSKESQSDFPANRKLKEKLKKTKPKDLDAKFHRANEEAFATIDCLDCANCCKTTSPIFIQTDIDRLARSFRMKSSEFIDKYLHRDSDGDYVLNFAPCPFLSVDNKCFVYEDRPKACREYPHTDRKNMLGILDLSLKNTLVCPAVLKIFYEIGKEYRK
ncbi:YkgJ family cysteine cluster protein [Algoriphagus jejuensis]|uniref:YkgJ family cysteine cluster protein n=1 Tax=Algoriphagus jejuensis TaxID=419934 RepID=UPI0031DA78E7